MKAMQIDNYVSSTTTVLNGIPQGSVPGPLLFVSGIHYNYTVAEIHNVSIKLFANNNAIRQQDTRQTQI